MHVLRISVVRRHGEAGRAKDRREKMSESTRYSYGVWLTAHGRWWKYPPSQGRMFKPTGANFERDHADALAEELNYNGIGCEVRLIGAKQMEGLKR